VGALRLAREVTVVARAEPTHKLRLVEALQRAGEVVVVTGDGVNDAPALVRADVGVAMGRSGTEVAKDASKVVITDDDLGTIVAAIEKGRVVHRNVRKTLVLLLGTSNAELVVLTAATIAALTLGWIAWRTALGVAPGAVRTEAFTLLAVCEWYGVLVCRAGSRPALHRRVLANRWLVGGLVAANVLQLAAVYVPAMNRALGTEPLPLGVTLALGGVGAVVLIVGELVRRALAWRRAARAKPSA